MFEAEVNDKMVLHCPAVAVLKMLHAKSRPPCYQSSYCPDHLQT